MQSFNVSPYEIAKLVEHQPVMDFYDAHRKFQRDRRKWAPSSFAFYNNKLAKSSATPVAQIRVLLASYVEGNSLTVSFNFFGKRQLFINRHHLNEVKAILADIEQNPALPLELLLTKLRQISLKSAEGSLGTRLQFIEEMIVAPLTLMAA